MRLIMFLLPVCFIFVAVRSDAGDKYAPNSNSFIGRSTPDAAVWTKAFENDFNTPCARGNFLKTYPDWSGYPTNFRTTDKSGHYDPNQVAVLAATDQNGNAINVMDVLCAPSPSSTLPPARRKGTFALPVSAAMFPTAFGWPGVAGIRVEQRIRVVNGASGWHIANLLWPVSEKWPHDGEIDYYETDANSRGVHIFAHHYGATSGSNQSSRTLSLDQSQFHVVAVEWIPGQSIKWYVDGALRAKFTKKIEPRNDPMRLVLQIESQGNPTQSCSVQYDWITIWKLNNNYRRKN